MIFRSPDFLSFFSAKSKIVWVESARKNSKLFIDLLAEMRRTYRSLQRIVLILDNVNTHKSRKTKAFLTPALVQRPLAT